MSSLIELIELLNTCSPWRAGAYIFFITVFSYIVINKLTDGIVSIIFVLKGYNKTKKNKIKDEDVV